MTDATPQAALLSAQNPLLKRCYTMSEPHLSGYRVVIGFERLEDAQDAHEYIAKLQATQKPVQAGSASLLDGCKSIMDSIAVSSSVIEHNKQAEPVQAGELPAFEQWWRQRQLLTFQKDYDQSRLADWGAAYKPAAKDAWQARAALSARKPLTDETFVAACNGCPTPGKCKDTSGCASAGMNVPTYYVRHPDDTYTAADPQPRFNGIGLEVKP